MNREQIRARIAEQRRARAKQRKEAAAAREAARRADRDRHTALRLQGTALDKHAKEVNAARGAKAIAKNRARIAKEKAAELARARQIADEEMAEIRKEQRAAEKAAKQLDKEKLNPLVPQQPREKGASAGKIFGAFDAEKLETVNEKLALVLGMFVHFQAMRDAWSVQLGIAETDDSYVTDEIILAARQDARAVEIAAVYALDEAKGNAEAAAAALETALAGMVTAFKERREK